MEPVSQLEAHYRHSINDGMVTSSNFHTSRKEAQQHGCAPRAPWSGAIDSLKHELMRVDGGGGGGGDWALKCPARQGADVEALCAAAKQALGSGRDLAVTVADGPRADVLTARVFAAAPAHSTPMRAPSQSVCSKRLLWLSSECTGRKIDVCVSLSAEAFRARFDLCAQTFLESAKAAGVGNILVVALDAAAAAAASAASPGVAVFSPGQEPPAVFTRAASGKALGPATVKWAVGRALLSLGAFFYVK